MKQQSSSPILFADDDENDTFFFQMAVHEAEISNPLLTFTDGQGVIEYLKQPGLATPSLLVLDLKMPRVGGLDVLIWLRAGPECKRVPAVVLSASQQEQDAHQALALGAAAYRVKPVDLSGLVAIVREMKERWLSQPVDVPVSRA